MFSSSVFDSRLRHVLDDRFRLVAIALSVSVVGSLLAASGFQSASAAGCAVAVAGDVAGKNDLANAKATAALIKSEGPAKVVVPGDLAYQDGTPEEFAKYYDVAWGSLKSITMPAPGNHEYNSGGAGYYAYFNGIAKNYGFDVCGWRFISVDPYASMSNAAAFIKSDAAANSNKPLAVYWHSPRFSSGSGHGSDPSSQPLWAASVAAGAKLVLNAHDHNYERFAPMDVNGKPSATGTREFVSGNGGHHPRGMGSVAPNSEKRVSGTPGVLFLSLRGDGYSWNYKDIKGVVGDTGSTTFPGSTSSSSSTTSSSTLTPAIDAPIIAPPNSIPRVSLVQVDSLVVTKASGYAPNSKITIDARVTGGRGTGTVTTNASGWALLAFSLPTTFATGPIAVTATGNNLSATKTITYIAVGSKTG